MEETVKLKKDNKVCLGWGEINIKKGTDIIFANRLVVDSDDNEMIACLSVGGSKIIFKKSDMIEEG